VEPVDVWIKAMADQQTEDITPVYYHVLLALRDPDEEELEAVRPSIDQDGVFWGAPGDLLTRPRGGRPLCLPVTPQNVKRTRLEDLTILEGGMALEYYPASNCGLIAYFIVRGGDTGDAGA
jgi:hypothetical protein